MSDRGYIIVNIFILENKGKRDNVNSVKHTIIYNFRSRSILEQKLDGVGPVDNRPSTD